MIDNLNIIENIFMISVSVTETEIEKLRIEEELLWLIVKTTKHSLAVKSAAFDRLKRIQKKQLELMGEHLKR